jgi:hypothetical protein
MVIALSKSTGAMDDNGWMLLKHPVFRFCQCDDARCCALSASTSVNTVLKLIRSAVQCCRLRDAAAKLFHAMLQLYMQVESWDTCSRCLNRLAAMLSNARH